MLKDKRFFEGDNGITIPTPAEIPPAVVHTVTEVPALAKSGADSALDLPRDAIHETLKGLTAATEALTLAANRLADTASKGGDEIKDVIEEPITSSEEKASEVSPEVVSPPKERYIRRNGRKVTR